MAGSRNPVAAQLAKKKFYAVLLMDRSSSMQRFGDIPLRSINAYLQRLKSSGQASFTEASIVIFDHAADTLVPMQPIADIKELRGYPVGRGTRLHGTVADTIELTMERVLEENAKGATVSASVAVLTDGHDTSTPAGKHLPRLRRGVISADDLGFQLIAVGIGIDGTQLARDLWFPLKHAITVDPDGIEILKAADKVSLLVEEFSASFDSPGLLGKP